MRVSSPYYVLGDIQHHETEKLREIPVTQLSGCGISSGEVTSFIELFHFTTIKKTTKKL